MHHGRNDLYIDKNFGGTLMHVTPRTFQRRLATHNLHYQGLLDGLREQLASRYLTRGELTLVQLAQILGFSEQSAFQRAFKQWTGTTPGRYRQLFSE